MLTIRLHRTGKKHQPSYRVVVVEHTRPVTGHYLESLGNYNPRISQFSVDTERVKYWLDHGAQPSERIAKLLKNAGVEHKLIVLPDYSKKPKRVSKKAAPEAPAAATEAATTEEATPEVAPTDETEVAEESSSETASETTEEQPTQEE